MHPDLHKNAPWWRGPSAALLLAQLAFAVPLAGQLGRSVFQPGPRHPAIAYFEPASDPVSALGAEVAAGRAALGHDPDFGYLRSLLAELEVPAASQLLVFSRNSLQSPYIAPRNPRMIFFNDSVVVAAIRGAPLIEIAVQDAEKGVVFYALNQDRSAPPAIRPSRCRATHGGPRRSPAARAAVRAPPSPPAW